jgi:hypothetical protein
MYGCSHHFNAITGNGVDPFEARIDHNVISWLEVIHPYFNSRDSVGRPSYKINRESSKTYVMATVAEDCSIDGPPQQQ